MQDTVLGYYTHALGLTDVAALGHFTHALGLTDFAALGHLRMLSALPFFSLRPFTLEKNSIHPTSRDPHVHGHVSIS